jgi:hypothetical protein
MSFRLTGIPKVGCLTPPIGSLLKGKCFKYLLPLLFDAIYASLDSILPIITFKINPIQIQRL